MSTNGKLRIAQIVLSLGAGGTERLVIDLCKALDGLADLQVLCLDEPGAWATELTGAGIRICTLGRRPGFDWRLVARVGAKLREQRTEVVHCHHYTPYVYGCLGALASTRARVVYTEHGRLTDAPWTTKRRLANALLGRLPGAYFAVSENLRAHMVEGGMPPERVGVIYNGIAPGEVPGASARAEARRRLGIDAPGALVLGTVARLDPVKDLPTLIDTFARLRTRGLDAWLCIVGDGAERERLERAVGEQGLTERVRFLGHRDDARALLAGLDVYVNCSITEGVSVTILEAMASGLPVVVTAVGGTPEVVEHDATGLLVPARDPEGLAQALARLVAEPALAARLTRAARVRIETRFATRTMLEQYLAVYGVDAGGTGARMAQSV